MTGREIIEREVFCQCGRCEEAVQDILRMEAMMCATGKGALTRRRNEVRRHRTREERRGYWRDYKRERARTG